MTNYEKIKSMSVDEMAGFLKTISDCEYNLCNECPLEGCASVKGIAKWLESESDYMKCKNCIHKEVCLHKANIETDTYACMGINYDTENCKYYEPNVCTDKQNNLRHCEDCHEECKE